MDISTNLIPLADGNQMPAHGFGVYKITDDQELIKAVTHAYQVGYRLFDTAQMYENEAALGKALKELNQPRDNYFITTKVAEKNQGYDQVIASVKESLARLQLDYVDLLLVHWPVNKHFFATWRAFEDLKKAGLTKSIGVSNYSMIHLQYLATQAREMPVVDQLERHPWLQETPMIKYNQEHQIVTQAWAPLGRGQLMEEPVLKQIADHHDRSVAQVILRWHLQSGISFIPKSVHEARISQNAAIYDFSLTDEEMALIASLDKNHRLSQEPELVYEFNQQYPH
ncbi:aldo/keto reductase [Limosilactobacillus fermentum]|uniref:Aldo/keto reductase n=1 Tax=Limosilactobacillus fermentum TaxID=1613 RepID=A0A843R0R9_LIMFE|nr:aldo/keto reductase [Limosilactobacillus fermentum]MPQ35618.1 aldo/keto reductase [Limosilactobacillus fermentum]